jgi:hypothetical protein
MMDQIENSATICQPKITSNLKQCIGDEHPFLRPPVRHHPHIHTLRDRYFIEQLSMASLVQFMVDDSSPTVSYAPFGDTFSSPDLSSGWNPHWDDPGFSSQHPGAIGSGTSLHITSLDSASLRIQWKGVLLGVGAVAVCL